MGEMHIHMDRVEVSLKVGPDIKEVTGQIQDILKTSAIREGLR